MPTHPEHPHLVLGRDIMQSPDMHRIEAVVDEEVYAFLAKREKEGYDLNTVLRRLLGFEDAQREV
jgi:hypothetical protein